MEIPKIFWKYYDLYRRKQLTINEYATKTGLLKETIECFLQEILKNSK